MTDRRVYIAIACFVVIIEIAIATGVVGGAFVRGSLGDLLVVVLLYALLRALPCRPPISAGLAIGAGVIAEALQYLQFADRIGLPRGSILSILIGNTFSPADLLMYLLGGMIAWALDRAVLVCALRAR